MVTSAAIRLRRSVREAELEQSAEVEVEDSSAGSEIQTLTIAVKILDMLASGRRELKAASIARELAMTPPRTWRHLRTMQSMGLVDQSASTGAFRLGWKLVQLGQSAAAQSSLTEIAHSHMLALRDQLELTVYLALPFKDGAVVAQCLPGGHMLSLVLHPGTFFACHAGASSRVILAFSSPQRQARLLAQPLSAEASPDPIVGKRQLKTRLAAIRERYYEVAMGSSVLKIAGIAAPIFDHNNDVVAAVGLLTDVERHHGQPPLAHAAALKRCAARISSALGASRWQQHVIDDEVALD
jgi:DNA-binding IclR family transcriptional regulator